ncbi:MAG: hypothetical protein ISS27_01255 [Candidatus Omnitrophica bacterium]|nr:hypothetical protein [Candidatus Omnitrophota bacterium]
MYTDIQEAAYYRTKNKYQNIGDHNSFTPCIILRHEHRLYLITVIN